MNLLCVIDIELFEELGRDDILLQVSNITIPQTAVDYDESEVIHNAEEAEIWALFFKSGTIQA